MSILVNSSTRVITQGMTGKTGAFHTRACRAYANPDNFVAGVNPRKAGTDMDGIPIYGTVAEAKAATGANASVIYVPPAGAAAAILEAVEAELDLVVCITEGIPVLDMLRVKSRMRELGSKTLLLGPNCPGLITPEEMKIGIMRNEDRHHARAYLPQGPHWCGKPLRHAYVRSSGAAYRPWTGPVDGRGYRR